jgi:hypothetical protein
MEQEVKKITASVEFYGVKTFAIIYISICYFIFGYLIAKLSNTICDTLFGKDYKNDMTIFLVFQSVFQIVLTIILCGLTKKFMLNKLPHILEGVGGFKYSLLKELIHSGGIAWAIGIMVYQKSLKDKIMILKSKF